MFKKIIFVIKNNYFNFCSPNFIVHHFLNNFQKIFLNLGLTSMMENIAKCVIVIRDDGLF